MILNGMNDDADPDSPLPRGAPRRTISRATHGNVPPLAKTAAPRLYYRLLPLLP